MTVRGADNGHWAHYTLTITLIMSSETVISISISSYIYSEKLYSVSPWAGLEWIIEYFNFFFLISDHDVMQSNF